MGAFLYALSTYIGYFLFMLIFAGIAIATAKRKAAWIWYAIGAVIQLLGMLGNQKDPNANIIDPAAGWVIYIVLLLITARIIGNRYKKALSQKEENGEFENQGIMDDKGMNRKLGTKWFTFYTKVRPWIACFFALPTVVDFLEYLDTYLSNWWMLLYFAGAIASPILCIMVAIKSSDDYVDFVRFVKGVLLFETINFAYQLGVQQYVKSQFIIAEAILYFVIALAIYYFVWYRLNVKYFEKRILTAPNYGTELTSEDKKSQKDIEDMLKAKAEEYRQKGLEPPKTIEMNLAGPGQSMGNKASSASQPFHINLSPADAPPAKDALCDTALQTPEEPPFHSINISPADQKPYKYGDPNFRGNGVALSLSEEDAPFKKYGDFATPANDLMVQKQPEPLDNTPTNEPKAESNDVLFCRKCGTQLLTDSVFCYKCGTKVETL